MRPCRPALLLFAVAAAAVLGCARGPSFDERKKAGIDAFKAGRTGVAVEALDACAREAPQDFETRYYLARAQEEAQNFRVALREWDHVLLLRPEFAEGHYRKGNTLAMGGQLMEAIECWTRATEIDPTFAQAYLNRGKAYEDLERWDDAAGAYGMAIRADSTFSPAYLNLALLFEAAEKWDYALEMFDKAIRLDPAFTGPYLNRIQILILLGRKAEAGERIRELQEMENIDPVLSDSLRALLSRVED